MIPLVASPHRILRLSAVGMLFVSTLTGCGKIDDVQTYTVSREHEEARRKLVFSDRPNEPKAPTQVAGKSEPGRLVGVMLPHGEEMWFFKMLGPDEAVKGHVEQVKSFVSTVKFDKNEPSWTVPKGWTELPGDAVTFTSFVLDPATPTIKLAVSRFPGQQDLTANVNRWRGQLKLPPVDAEEAKKSAVPLKTESGEALWVELSGTFSGASGMPPFAGGARPAGPMAGPIDPNNKTLPAGHPPIDNAVVPPQQGGAPKPAVDAPFKYELPTGWTAAQTNGFTLAAFTVAVGSETLRITVSEAQGDLLSNINRWRVEQLGLPAIDGEQLLTATTKMKVSGLDADVVELIAPAGAGPQKAIFGVIAKKSATSNYFIKLIGDAPLAQREREHFMKFVASIRFDR